MNKTTFSIPPRTVVQLVLLGCVHTAGLVAFVLLVRDVINEIGAPTGPRMPTTSLVALAVMSCVLAGSHGLVYRLTESAGYEHVQRLRLVLYDHLTGLPPRSVLRSSRGALLLRFTGDLSVLRTWVSRGLARGIVSAVTVGGVVVLVFVLDAAMGAWVAGVLLLGAGGSVLAGYGVQRSARSVRWRRSLLASNVAEQLGGLASIQLFRHTSGERSRLAAQNDDLTKALLRMVRVRSRLRVISAASTSAAVVGVLAVGSREVVHGRTTVGTVVAAVTALRFSTAPFRSLGQSHEYWQAAQVSRRKLREFCSRPSQVDPPGARRLEVHAGEVTVRGVGVAGALYDVDLTAGGGEVLAVVGPNGAGKSTLLNVIAGLVRPDQGDVLVDGSPVAARSRRSLHQHLGMVGPDLPLVRGTLRRNLLYRYPGADTDEIDRVVLACGLDRIAAPGADPLSMWLTEGGMNLPPGHRQRIALARAVMGNPRLLLLDEPTTNLDEAGREIVRRVIARHRGTVIMVTNDSEDAALADQVCRMDAGRVVEALPGEVYREEARVAGRVLAGRLPW